MIIWDIGRFIKGFAITLAIAILLSAANHAFAADNSSYALERAKASSGLTATAETNRKACAVDVSNSENPYDIEYDYGKEYDAIAAKCDWNKVFDAGYYKDTFPGLAKLYHNDDELLLKHFQTVGIREGRQASEKFNVAEYMEGAPASVKAALGDAYEGYYIYYMLSGDSNSYGGDGSCPTQMRMVLTAVQKEEIDMINASRKANKSAEAAVYSELSAFANYRAYVDAVSKLHGHDYIYDIDGLKDVSDVLVKMGVETFSENTIKTSPYKMLRWFETYKTSPKHYETAIKDVNMYVGVSNAYINGSFKTVQFDVFVSGDSAKGLDRNASSISGNQ